MKSPPLLKWRQWCGGGWVVVAVLLVSAGGSQALAQSAVVVPGRAQPAARRVILPGRLFMAGNRRSGIWMVAPTWFGKTSHQRGFVLLQHLLNHQEGAEDRWRQVNKQVLVGVPQAMAVLAGTVDGKEVSSAYVMFSGGLVWAYGADLRQNEVSLPRLSQPVAAVGSSRGLYALVWGRPPMHVVVHPAPTTTNPLQVRQSKTTTQPIGAVAPPKPPVNLPRQAPAQAVGFGQRPVTTQPVVPRPAKWLLYEFNGIRWHCVEASGMAMPTANGNLTDHRITLVWLANRLWAFWKNPGKREQIDAQNLQVGEKISARWSHVLTWNTGKSLGTLLPLSVDGRLLVLWASPQADRRIKIQGAQVQAAGARRLQPTHLFHPVLMNCGHDATELIGAAADGDSVAVVCKAGSGVLRQITLDRRGNVIAPTFQIKAIPANSVNPENIQLLMTVALLVLLALSLWQRQQTPPPGTLPKGTQIARLYLRIPAALLDLAIPTVAVAIIFGAVTEPLFVAMVRDWANVYSSPVLVAHEPSIWWMLGLYVGHVGLCECVFGRSIGKAVFRLRVVNMAGARPALTPVLIRNLMRLPELALPVLLIFLVVSTDRQRLGDLLARTLVVQAS